MAEKEIEFKEHAPFLNRRQHKLVLEITEGLEQVGFTVRRNGLELTVGVIPGEEVRLHVTSFILWT